MSGLSRRALFTGGLSRLLDRADEQFVVVAASEPARDPVLRAEPIVPPAWPRGGGAELWPHVLAELPRSPGRDLLDLDDVDVDDLATLPYAEADFDVVMSAFGPMFSSDGRAAIDEMFRVVRPGGTVAFTAWTSLGVIGRLLRLAASHDPLPRGVPGPLAWGREERLRQELERHCDDGQIHPRELTLRFATCEQAAERLSDALGPLAIAPRQDELRAQARELVEPLAVAQPAGIELGSRYLLVVAERACPILTRSHAQDEDSLRRKEALQEDGERKDPCASRLHEPHSREEVAEEEAPAR